MKWEETIASSCRYGDDAGAIFGDAEIIWENSEADYQGSANLLARFSDGSFAHYSWTYGSCSGCDEWESRDLTPEQVVEEMKNGMAVIPDVEHLKRYLHLEGEYKNALLPTTNSPTNGSVPGMMKYLSGGWGDDFESMRKTATDWLWTDFEEQYKKDIEQEKLDKINKKEQNKLKREQRKLEIERLIETIKEKLTPQELKIVKFKK